MNPRDPDSTEKRNCVPHSQTLTRSPTMLKMPRGRGMRRGSAAFEDVEARPNSAQALVLLKRCVTTNYAGRAAPGEPYAFIGTTNFYRIGLSGPWRNVAAYQLGAFMPARETCSGMLLLHGLAT